MITRNYFILFFSYALIIIFFLNTLYHVNPSFMVDANTHRQYLFATTFGITGDDFVTFPKWVYAPWYYFFCSYTFGPIFFSLYKLNFLNLNEACMYTMLFGTFVLKLLTVLGSYKFAQKIFKKNKDISALFAIFIVLIPFANKDFYIHASETMGIAVMPFCFYFLINFYDKKKIKYLVYYLIFFGLGSSLKMNILIPYIIFNFIFILFFLKKQSSTDKIKLFFFSAVSLLIFLTISKIFIGNWLWENSDIRNFEKGYGEPPPLTVFINFTLLDYFINPFEKHELSFWTLIIADFFSDATGNSFNYHLLGMNPKYISWKIRSGILLTLLIIIFLSLGYIKYLKSLKNFSFKHIFNFNFTFSLSFFIFIFVSILYSFFVFHKGGGSWETRYSGVYAFPFVYMFLSFIIKSNLNNIFDKKINLSFIIMIIIMSVYQRLIINF